MGQRGRIGIDQPWDIWLEEIETSPSCRDFPNDPADQIIVAAARCHGLPLVTADEKIRWWGKTTII